jgi:hypothetical protein
MDGQAIDLATATVPFAARPAFAEATKPQDFESDPRWINMQKARCIRMRNFKYVLAPWNPAARGVPMPSEALYDLASDPAEQRNLLDNPTPEARQLVAELAPRLDVWARSAAPLPTRYDRGQRDEVTKRLASLGYVDGGDGTEITYAQAASREFRASLERMKQLGYTDEQLQGFLDKFTKAPQQEP